MLTVVAAIIEDRGRLLICQRRKDDSFPLKWEFPGGKVRADESPEAALARELREELGVEATVGDELYRTRYQYPEHAEELELIFFAARLGSQVVESQAFEQIVWAEPAALPSYDFLAADRELIAKLARGGLAGR